ncbi:hypothetical protein F5Y10DRAFT_290417 [Nemania abortiva]|nr:hypothetical protein F5Y10DRAFT_290417 [Nemania abortiva]
MEAKAIDWNPKANKALIATIIEHGQITEPSDSFPLGQVHNWSAITDQMNKGGYRAKKNALQVQWSKLARGTLQKACQGLRLPGDMSPAKKLEFIAAVAGLGPAQSPSRDHHAQGCEGGARGPPFLHIGSGDVMMGTPPIFVDPRNLGIE